MKENPIFIAVANVFIHPFNIYHCIVAFDVSGEVHYSHTWFKIPIYT